MNSTIELPEALLRQAEAIAVALGMTLNQLLAETLRNRLQFSIREPCAGDARPPWMAGFGALSDLGEDHRRVREAIEHEFGKCTPEGPA